jgi:hypothetical protein
VLAAGLVVGAGPARAEAALPDSAAAPRASSAGAVPDSAARGLRLTRRGAAFADTARVRIPQGRFDAPRWVMLRSLVLPGWGQLHNGSWLKAALLGGGEVWIIGGIVEDDRRVRQLRADAERARLQGDNDGFNRAVDAYNSRLDRLVSREWLLGGLLVYSLMDAYVDAHFKDFKVEFEHDPALPGGVPPGGQTRLSVGWAF